MVRMFLQFITCLVRVFSIFFFFVVVVASRLSLCVGHVCQSDPELEVSSAAGAAFYAGHPLPSLLRNSANANQPKQDCTLYEPELKLHVRRRRRSRQQRVIHRMIN